MTLFKTIIKLFPRSKAFRAFVDTSFRKLVKAITAVPDDERKQLDLIYADIFPDTTREVERWEKQFGIIFTAGYSLAIRRSLLDSFWKIKRGGQSDTYLQGLLQKIDSKILVVENIPVGNPRVSNTAYTAIDGNSTMYDGGKNAIDGRYIGDSDFVPTVLRNGTEQPYAIPLDERYWEMCFYVCGGVYRNAYKQIVYVQKVNVPTKWKNFIEYIVLKTKPVHTTAVMFIEYTEDGND